MNFNNVDVNKLAIIIIVGIGAISGIFLNQENITSVCIGGLVGYLSKDYTTTNTSSTVEDIENIIKESVSQINETINKETSTETTIISKDEDEEDDDESYYEGA